MFKSFMTIMMLATIAAPVVASDDHQHHPPATQPAEPRAESEAQGLPPIACRYESSIIRLGQYGRESWDRTLWREPDRIEIRESHRNTGERWDRDDAGRIVSYMKIFHNERRIIEMVPGDLATTRTEFDWDRLATVVGRDTLRTRLTDAGPESIMNRSARRYQGHVDGVEVEVLWLEDQQVPAMVRQVHPDHITTLMLKEIAPIADATWPRADVAAYEITDFADIGDKETDPFLQRLGHSHGHEH